jgi:hypothetical protein
LYKENIAIPLAPVARGKISVTTQLSTGTNNSVAASLVTRKFLVEVLLFRKTSMVALGNPRSSPLVG